MDTNCAIVSPRGDALPAWIVLDAIDTVESTVGRRTTPSSTSWSHQAILCIFASSSLASNIARSSGVIAASSSARVAASAAQPSIACVLINSVAKLTSER